MGEALAHDIFSLLKNRCLRLQTVASNCPCRCRLILAALSIRRALDEIGAASLQKRTFRLLAEESLMRLGSYFLAIYSHPRL